MSGTAVPVDQTPARASRQGATLKRPATCAHAACLRTPVYHACPSDARIRACRSVLQAERPRLSVETRKPAVCAGSVCFAPAGAEGLEPPTPGFGDRCSTN